MLPQGPATRIIVPPNVEILAFLASFRAILAVFWAVCALWALLDPFEPGGKRPLVASSRVRSDLVWSFLIGGRIWLQQGGPL